MQLTNPLIGFSHMSRRSTMLIPLALVSVQAFTVPPRQPCITNDKLCAMQPRMDMSFSDLAPLLVIPAMAVALPVAANVAASTFSKAGVDGKPPASAGPSAMLKKIFEAGAAAQEQGVSFEEAKAQFAASQERAAAESAAAARVASEVAFNNAPKPSVVEAAGVQPPKPAEAAEAAELERRRDLAKAERAAAAKKAARVKAAAKRAADKAAVDAARAQVAAGDPAAAEAAAKRAARERALAEALAREVLGAEEAAKKAAAEAAAAEAEAKAEALADATAVEREARAKQSRAKKVMRAERRAERKSEVEVQAAVALATAGIYVTPEKVAAMSQKQMQSACSALGLPVRGKAAKLKQRLSRVETQLLEQLECNEEECVLQN